MKKVIKLLLIGLSTLTLTSCSTKTVVAGPQGEKGDTGEVGPQGPSGEDGQDGKDGKDGVSVVSITLAYSEGNVDTYVILYSDGTTSSFTVTNGTNGKDGEDGQDGKDGDQGIQGNPGADGHSPVITISEDGYWVIDGVKTSTFAKGEKGDQGEQGEKGDQGVSITNTYIDENGDLIVVFSNGTTSNAGHVKNVSTHTVTFDSNGGSPVDSITVNDGELITRPTDPTKEGYLFDGWFTSDNEQWVFAGCVVKNDLTLYAKWNELSYNITYVLNGGTNDPSNPSTYKYGTTYTLNAPSKDECTFDGWYEDAAFTVAKESIVSTDCKDLIFYAKFSPIQYTVTFVTNGGTSIDPAVGAYGEAFPEISTTRDGYLFAGWYRDSTFSTAYELPLTFEKASYTLYAKWEQIVASISFKCSSTNTYIGTSKSSMTVTGGTTIKVNSGTAFYLAVYLSGYTYYKKYTLGVNVVSATITEKDSSTSYVGFNIESVDKNGNKSSAYLYADKSTFTD